MIYKLQKNNQLIIRNWANTWECKRKWANTWVRPYVLLLLFSCSKKTEITQPSLNINFPAAYVVNGQDNSISIINLQTNEVNATIHLNQYAGSVNLNYPHHIYLSPDKTKLSLSVPGHDLSLGHIFTGAEDVKGAVLVINSQNGAFLNYAQVPQMNHTAIFSPDGSEIWASLISHNNPNVNILTNDLSTKFVLKGIEAAPEEISFSKDGNYAFIPSDESRFVQVFDVKTKENITNIKVDLAPNAAWVADDGNAYVTSLISQSIIIINTKTLTAYDAIDLGFPPAYAIFNSLTNELWISHATGNEIVIYKKNASDVSQNSWQKDASIAVGNDAHAIVFTNDKKTCYVSNQGDNTVSVIDVLKRQKIKDIIVGNKPNGIVLKE